MKMIFENEKKEFKNIKSEVKVKLEKFKLNPSDEVKLH